VVFSVREASELYEVATAKAWIDAEMRLSEIAAAAPDKKLEIVSVHYDRLPGESLIEELPDEPKSSRPDAVEVAVRLRIRYALR
jgi:hypothetical protein